MENKRKRQRRITDGFDWDLGDLCFSDSLPIGKNATARHKQRERDQVKRTGHDTRQDYQVKYGPV